MLKRRREICGCKNPSFAGTDGKVLPSRTILICPRRCNRLSLGFLVHRRHRPRGISPWPGCDVALADERRSLPIANPPPPLAAREVPTAMRSIELAQADEPQALSLT